METRPSHALNVTALLLLVAAFVAKVVVVISLLLRGPLNAFQIGQIVGSTFPAAAVAVLLAFVTYLVSRRSNIAGAAAFAICIVVSIFIDFRLAASRERTAGFAKLKAAQQEIVAETKEAFEAGESTTGGAKRLERLSDQLGNAAAGLGGNEQKATLAVQRVIGGLSPLMVTYENALDELMKAGTVSADTLDSPEAIRDRRVLVEKFQVANEGLREFFKTVETRLREELSKENLPARYQREVLTGFVQGSNMELNLTIRECDAELAAQMFKMLDLLAKEEGKWHLQGENVLFDNPPATDQFNALQAEITDAAERQGAAQKQLLERASKATK